jgi:hypothetical protein
VAGRRPAWLRLVFLFTAAGAVTSALVGGSLGAVGSVLVPDGVRPVGVLVVLGTALLAAAREFGIARLPLPQPSRQTREVWGKIGPLPLAATLWGLDLGLLVTTRFTFAGTYLVLLLPILVGGAGFGAAVLVSYWLGRALSVWVAPLLVPDAASTLLALDAVDGHFRQLQLLNVLGIALVVVYLVPLV